MPTSLLPASRSVTALVTLVFFAASPLAQAAGVLGSGKAAAAPAPAEKVVQKREYEGSIRGIRALMNDLKSEKPDVYEFLKTDFEDLDSRQSRANYVYWGSISVATGLFVYGFVRASTPSDCGYGGSCESKFSFYPFVGALAIYYGGTIGSSFMAPSRQEYLNFTNKHNKRNPGEQLEWTSSFAFVPVTGGGTVQLAVGF